MTFLDILFVASPHGPLPHFFEICPLDGSHFEAYVIFSLKTTAAVDADIFGEIDISCELSAPYEGQHGKYFCELFHFKDS